MRLPRNHNASRTSARLLPRAIAVLLLAAPLESQASDWLRSDTAFVKFGYLEANVLDAEKRAGGVFEYRLPYSLFRVLHPHASLYVTDHVNLSASFGLAYLRERKRSYFALSSSVGFIDSRSKNVLGSTVEFISKAEMGLKFDRNHWVCLAFGHISNAHLSKINPGAEFVELGVGTKL